MNSKRTYGGARRTAFRALAFAGAAVAAATMIGVQAKAQVRQKEAAVEVARTNLDHTVIRSPIDGVVVARNVDVGQTVAASLQAPTIFTIAQDLTRMQVYSNADEADVGRIKVGARATFKVSMAAVIAAVTRAMLRRSRPPRTSRRCTGTASPPRLAATRKMAASDDEHPALAFDRLWKGPGNFRVHFSQGSVALDSVQAPVAFGSSRRLSSGSRRSRLALGSRRSSRDASARHSPRPRQANFQENYHKAADKISGPKSVGR